MPRKQPQEIIVFRDHRFEESNSGSVEGGIQPALYRVKGPVLAEDEHYVKIGVVESHDGDGNWYYAQAWTIVKAAIVERKPVTRARRPEPPVVVNNAV